MDGKIELQTFPSPPPELVWHTLLKLLRGIPGGGRGKSLGGGWRGGWRGMVREGGGTCSIEEILVEKPDSFREQEEIPKKKRKFSSYMRKLRMTNGLLIHD